MADRSRAEQSITYLDFDGDGSAAPPEGRGHGPYITETADGPVFSELPPLRLPDPRPRPSTNPNIQIEFDQKDLTIGAPRYSSAKPVAQNLSMQGANPIPHTSIEVRFTSKDGKPLPMTRRLVRTWNIVPVTPDASVSNLRSWRIVGLDHPDFIPFSPFRLPNERPAMPFEWDRPGRYDAPGFLAVRENLGAGAGQLQEFIAGNRTVGGVYYQVYTLADRNGVRVFSTDAFAFDAKGYQRLMKLINDPDFRKENLHKLLFMPQVPQERDKTAAYPATPALVPHHGAKPRVQPLR
jgi:hypothetical protein